MSDFGEYIAKESVTETSLPPIDCPDVAIAETSLGRQTFQSIPTPRGVVFKVSPGTPTTFKVPHKQSAPWFKEVFSGFMSAQSISFSQYATDTLKLLDAENKELEACAKSRALAADPCTLGGNHGNDESLPPRPVGIWLLANYENVGSTRTWMAF